jgi:hypothetical protein
MPCQRGETPSVAHPLFLNMHPVGAPITAGTWCVSFGHPIPLTTKWHCGSSGVWNFAYGWTLHCYFGSLQVRPWLDRGKPSAQGRTKKKTAGVRQTQLDSWRIPDGDQRVTDGAGRSADGGCRVTDGNLTVTGAVPGGGPNKQGTVGVLPDHPDNPGIPVSPVPDCPGGPLHR